MKRLVLLFVFILITLTLGGCAQASAPSTPLCRVVTEVTVTYENGSIQTRRAYTDPQKMQEILNYLRWIDPYGTPEENPEAMPGSDFYIVLSHSDGCQKTYHQKADRFLQGTDGIWKKIDPGRAEELGRILGLMRSDHA